MGSQVLTDVRVEEVHARIPQNEGCAHGTGGQDHQLTGIRGEGLAVPFIGHTGGFPVRDLHSTHLGVVEQRRTVLNGLRDLRESRTHQGIVLAGHAGIQTVPAENAAVAVRRLFEDRNPHVERDPFVQNACLVPILARVPVNVQNAFGPSKMGLEIELAPSLDARLLLEAVEIDDTGP